MGPRLESQQPPLIEDILLGLQLVNSLTVIGGFIQLLVRQKRSRKADWIWILISPKPPPPVT